MNGAGRGEPLRSGSKQSPLIVLKERFLNRYVMYRRRACGKCGKAERRARLFQAAVGIRIKKMAPKATDEGCGFPRVRHFPQVFFFFFGSFFFFFLERVSLVENRRGRVTNQSPYWVNG
jgi:hypothetical protein